MGYFGRTALTVAGMAIGWYIGGPYGSAALGMAIGGFAGSVLGTFVFPITMEDAQGPRLEDFYVQNSSYGIPIPIPFGTVRCAGNVIWTAGVVEHSHSEEVGGKGGGGTQTITSYSYSCSFAVGICKGPIDGVLKIWADGKLLYSITGESEVVLNSALSMTVFNGDETQLPCSIIEASEGAGQVPGFRGLAYIVFEDLDLTPFGNRIPNLNFEISTSIDYGTQTHVVIEGISLHSTTQVDSDPSNTLTFILTGNDLTVINVTTNTPTILNKEILASGGTVIAVDEGNVFYTTGPPNATGLACYKFDYNGNQLLKGPSDFNPGGDLIFMEVCKNSSYPYLWVGGGHISSKAFRFNKNTLELMNTYDLNTILSTTHARVFGVAIDESNGNAYLSVANDVFGGSNHHLVRLTPDGGCDIWDLGAYGTPNKIVFEPANGYLYIQASGNVIIVWDTNTDTYVKSITGASIAGYFLRPKNHKIYAGTGALTSVYEIDTVSAEIVRTLTDYWDGFPTLRYVWYEPLTHSIFMIPQLGDLGKYYLDRGTAEAVNLSDIVSAICEMVDLEASEIDVTELTDLVHGYLINSVTQARRAIEPLQLAYFFDGVESDGKIKFLKRGRSSSVTISKDDLSAHAENTETPDPVVITQIQELDLPRILELSHVDPNLDYQPNVQSSRRTTVNTKETKNISLPIVLSADAAKQIVEKLHHMLWLERTKYSLKYGRKYLYLDPTDVVTLTVGDNTYVVRILNLEYGANGLINIESIQEDIAIYVSSAVGAEGEWIPPTAIPYVGSTLLMLVDSNLFRDEEDSISPSGFYYAATGYFDQWAGAAIYRSTDGGVSFSMFRSVVNKAVIGYATTALGDVDTPNIWDRGNSVTVTLTTPGGELSSDTEINILNGANGALLGNELIQFSTATLNGDGTYTLSNLLRGRRGTEHETGNHSTGERFILLTPTTIYRTDLGPSDLDLERAYRAVSLGMSYSSGVNQNFTNTGKGLMPYSPVHIRGSRDGSNNLTITWKRRTRVGGAWLDSVDASLGEDSEEYEIDVYDNGNIVRTIDSLTSETASYTAAQQTADGLTPGDPVHVKVYQLSETVGRGYAGDATI